MRVFLCFTIVSSAAILGAAGPAYAQNQFDVVHSFASQGAINPSAPLIQASDRNFYGTTHTGGISNLGTVFKMTPDGAVTVCTISSVGSWTGLLLPP